MHRIGHQKGGGEIKNIDDALNPKAGQIDTICGIGTVKDFADGQDRLEIHPPH